MTTHFPAALPAVPEDRWNGKELGYGGDVDKGTAWTMLEIDATSPDEAEKRALAFIDHNSGDNLRGEVAIVDLTTRSPRYRVHVALTRARF